MSAPSPDDGNNITRSFRVLAGFVAPVTILTALFLYFGYVWTDSFYEYFGVDAATLQFSPQDYMLRSVAALYVPVGTILLISLLFVWVQPSAVAFVLRNRHSRWWSIAWRILVGLGILLLLAGVVFFLVPSTTAPDSMLAPLSVAAGVLLLSYCRSLGRLRSSGRPRRAGSRERAATTLVLAVVTLCLFWSANSFAQQYGRGTAVTLSEDIRLRPAVVLDTTEELFLQLQGVTESSLPTVSADQQFHFRYRGLRLLAQAGDRMFFVSTQWSPGSGRALMLSAGPAIRLQFAAGQ
jgi:hypothetical protein